MKKLVSPSIFSFSIVLIGIIIFANVMSQAQEKLTLEPDPSYNEGGPARGHAF